MLELGGLHLQCQLGEHAGLHGASGEVLKTNEDGSVERFAYKLSWDAQKVGVDSEESFAKMLDWLAAA